MVGIRHTPDEIDPSSFINASISVSTFATPLIYPHMEPELSRINKIRSWYGVGSSSSC